MFREWLAATERRYNLRMEYAEGYPTSSVRCKVALKLRAGNADFLLMMDDDQAPTFNPLDYVADDLDVLGFPYPSVRINGEDPIVWFPAPMDEDAGLVRQDLIGGGCMLIARRVLEHPTMRAPFQDHFNDDGIWVEGEDMTFCRMAREAGFSIWCAMDKPLLHVKPAELLKIYLSRGARNG